VVGGRGNAIERADKEWSGSGGSGKGLIKGRDLTTLFFL
jgi:hypothetical protein